MSVILTRTHEWLNHLSSVSTGPVAYFCPEIWQHWAPTASSLFPSPCLQVMSALCSYWSTPTTRRGILSSDPTLRRQMRRHYNSYDYHTRLKNRLMSQTHLSGGQVGISPGSHRVQADFCCSWYFLFSISSQHERKCLWAKCICVRNIQRRNYFLWHTEPKHAFKGPNNITTHPGCNQQTRRIPTLGQRGRQPGPSHSEETTEKREEEVVKNMTDNREGRNRGQRSEVNHSYESVCGERFNEETLRGNIWSEDLRGSAQKCAEV